MADIKLLKATTTNHSGVYLCEFLLHIGKKLMHIKRRISQYKFVFFDHHYHYSHIPRQKFDLPV